MGAITFTQSLTQAEAQARRTLDVPLHERLSAGVALVHDGKVFQTTDGTWQVNSSSQEDLVYAVNGSCSCSDVHYNHPPRGLCKHRLAMFLSQRVSTLMQAEPAPVVPVPVDPETVPEAWPDNDPEEPAAPAPDPAVPLPEAPCSVNCHIVVAGRQVQVTLRGHHEQAVLTRLEAVLARYPQPQPATQASSPGAGKDWCPGHNCAMQENEKNGQRWFSHKKEDGTWCKGKRA
jgi:hypothetical protein